MADAHNLQLERRLEITWSNNRTVPMLRSPPVPSPFLPHHSSLQDMVCVVIYTI